MFVIFMKFLLYDICRKYISNTGCLYYSLTNGRVNKNNNERNSYYLGYKGSDLEKKREPGLLS